LKQGKKLFGKDYFDELLERICEIRASERRFYQKTTDIYAECSIDYQPKAEIAQVFYKTDKRKIIRNQPHTVPLQNKQYPHHVIPIRYLIHFSTLL